MRYPHKLIKFRLFEAFKPILPGLGTLHSGKITIFGTKYSEIYGVECDLFGQIYVEIYKAIWAEM